MTWFVLSLSSTFSLAIAELIQQHLLNLKKPLNARTSVVFVFLFQALLAIPFLFLPYYRDQIFSIFQPEVFYKALTVTIIASFSTVFYFKSLRVKDISISLIFISCSTIFSTILGIIFFGEGMAWPKFLGIFFILTAIVALNFKNTSLEKNHYYGLLASVLFGISYTLDKGITTKINPLVYIFWSLLSISVLTFLLKPRSIIKSLKGREISALKLVFLSSIFYFCFNISTFFAYKFGGEVGKIDAINNAEIFLVILFEFFILRRQKSIFRKIATALLATIGVIILGLY